MYRVAQSKAKRIFDVAIATFAIVVLLPLICIIALAIKFSSRGPVIFKQQRCGIDKRPFIMYKFRTMIEGAQDKGLGYEVARDDDRITTVGKVLRNASLDELPQFINVIKGNMSIVGPRPERAEFVQKFKDEIPGYMKKHMVKAGITGWAQVNGWRGDTCIKTRVEYDLFYIENWSLWFDLKIILLTLVKGFINPNAC